MEKVNFCWRCGRPIASQATKCIYCSAPTRRILRPARRCPFCDEPIRPKAVKCVHCGEFLDGRPKPQESTANVTASTGQQTFIIEKAVISTGGGLPPGMEARGLSAPSQASPSRTLEHSGPRVIEFNPQAGAAPPQDIVDIPVEAAIVRQETLALPPPKEMKLDDDEPLPIVGEPEQPQPPKNELALRTQPTAQASSSPEWAETLPAVVSPTLPARAGPVENRGLVVSQGQANTNLPAVRESGMMPALRGAARLISRAVKALKQKDDTVDAEFNAEDDKYRVCGMCQTELLATDNFCYHCGNQFAMRPKGLGEGRSRYAKKSNFLLYLMIVVCWGAILLRETFSSRLDPEMARTVVYAAVIAAPVFSFIAFIRKPGFFSRLLSLCFLAASAWVVYDAFLR